MISSPRHLYSIIRSSSGKSVMLRFFSMSRMDSGFSFNILGSSISRPSLSLLAICAQEVHQGCSISLQLGYFFLSTQLQLQHQDASLVDSGSFVVSTFMFAIKSSRPEVGMLQPAAVECPPPVPFNALEHLRIITPRFACELQSRHFLAENL